MKIICFNYKDLSFIKDLANHLPYEIINSKDVNNISFADKNTIVLVHYTQQEHTIDQISKIKHKYPSIPVVLTDITYRTQLAISALRIGIWDYITLPDEMVYLHQQIQKLMRSLQTNHASQRTMLKNCSAPQLQMACLAKTTRAKDYIDNHFSSLIEVNDLAKMCHMTYSTFSRYFYKEHGQTVINYLSNYRLKQAMKLLRLSRKTVQQIAFEVGFRDAAYFCKVFRAKTEQTPTQYRKNCFKTPA